MVPDCLVLWTLGCVTNQVAHVHQFLDPRCPVWEPSVTGQAKMCPEDQMNVHISQASSKKSVGVL